MIRWKFGDFKNEIERGILEFSGFKTRVTTFGPAERCSDAQKNAWLERMKALGRRAM
jgi:hypothetical protein